jgi:hypothetical protein
MKFVRLSVAPLRVWPTVCCPTDSLIAATNPAASSTFCR